MQLQLVHHFEIFPGVSCHIYLGLVFVERWAVLHEKAADDVGTVKSNLDIVRVIQ